MNVKEVKHKLSDSEAKILYGYHNETKFSDRRVWANSEDLDQTAPEGESDQGLYLLLYRMHLLDILPCGYTTLLKF